MTLWTDARVDLLRKLWADGLTASEIVAKLDCGLTRSAVLGKVHRLGLNGRVASGPAGRPPGAKVERKSGVNRQRVKGLRRVKESRRAGDAAAAAPHPQEPLNGTGVPLLDRGRFQCSWEIDGATKNVCGQPVSHGVFSWCRHHCEIGLVRPTAVNRQKRMAGSSSPALV